jgi:hypothetical protein
MRIERLMWNVGEYLSFVVGSLAILVLSVFCIWQGWNLWMIGTSTASLVGLVIAFHTDYGLARALGMTTGTVGLITAFVYGLYLGQDGSDDASTITVKACHVTSVDGYAVLETSRGSYTLLDGVYNGVSQPTGEGAASMLTVGRTYVLSVERGSDTYANVTGAHETTDNGQTCH